MVKSFHQQVVWITGASSGIGEALAYAFAAAQARIIISSRNVAELDRVKQQCKAQPDNILLLPLDLTDTEDIALKAAQGLTKWGRIDCLIHNAGIAARDTVDRTDMEVFRRVMETNYFGPVALTKAVLPSMLLAGKGQLVVVGSLSSKFGVPKLAAYAASKQALQGFFESLRTEVRKRGIAVTFVIPGFINTPILLKAIDGQGKVMGRNLAVNEKGMSSEQCATLILRAIAKGKQEAFIGGSETWSVYLHRFFPAAFNKAIASHPIRRLRKLLPWLFK